MTEEERPASGENPEFTVVRRAGGYSREDAIRVLSGLPPGPVPVKSADEISAELRAARVPPHPAQRQRAGQSSRARTVDEARVYLETLPCPRCGTEYHTWDRVVVDVDGELADHYTGECPVCGEQNTVVLRIAEAGSAPAGRLRFGGPGQSELLDPGEWLWLADLAASNVPTDDPAGAELALSIATAAMEEVIKFLPSGVPEVPPQTFWSDRGRHVRDREPGRFRRDRLVLVRDTYLRELRKRGVTAVPTVATVPMSHMWEVARGPLVAESNELLAAVHEARRSGRWERVDIYGERLDLLRHEYTTLVPFQYLARCPYTGALVSWPIDDVDLDGWYWWCDAPARQLPPRVPSTWLAMTGAMRLGQPVAPVPFVCRPGPGAPFVVPALLRDGTATAVIREVAVGPHTGWAITYFGTAPAAERVNLWGTDRSPVPDGAGGWADDDAAETEAGAERDFDLEPWLAAGRLLWIAPADKGIELRRGVADCPYLGLDGPHESPTIRDGVVSYPGA